MVDQQHCIESRMLCVRTENDRLWTAMDEHDNNLIFHGREESASSGLD